MKATAKYWLTFVTWIHCHILNSLAIFRLQCSRSLCLKFNKRIIGFSEIFVVRSLPTVFIFASLWTLFNRLTRWFLSPFANQVFLSPRWWQFNTSSAPPPPPPTFWEILKSYWEKGVFRPLIWVTSQPPPPPPTHFQSSFAGPVITFLCLQTFSTPEPTFHRVSGFQNEGLWETLCCRILDPRAHVSPRPSRRGWLWGRECVCKQLAHAWILSKK